jgi:ribosomal protein S18 acetylase RimI-like enzyme
MNNYIFKNAVIEDVEMIWELINKRIKWMDNNNIVQWNKTGYLDSYPRSYFEEKVLSDQLYVLKEEKTTRVLGAVVLLEQDNRWGADGLNSYYVHNLVSDPDVAGMGEKIMHFCEMTAIADGKDKIRLDCQASNKKLIEYYQRLGFKYAGTVKEGSYCGNKLEKKLGLYFEKIDIKKHRDIVVKFRKDSFKVSFGNTSGFGEEEEYLRWLEGKSRDFPEGFVLVKEDGKYIGQLELTIREYDGNDIGYVNLYYLIPEMRGEGKGKELHDYARRFFINNKVSEYHLRVSPSNATAIKFYRKIGMIEVGPEVDGKVIRMKGYL